MFRAENVISTKLKTERDEAVKDMSVAMKQHNSLVKDLKDKTSDV